MKYEESPGSCNFEGFCFFVINTLILFCLRALYHMRFFFAIYSVYFSVHKYHMAFSYYNQQYADTSLQFLTTQKEIFTVVIHDWEFVVFLVVFLFLLYFPANGQFSGLHKSAIDAALLHELFVSTALDNFATVKCSQFPSCVDFTGFNCIQNCVYCYYLSFFSKIALKHRPHYFHI